MDILWWFSSFLWTDFFFFYRSVKLIPEDDQIFTEVELNMLEKVINETTVGGECIHVFTLSSHYQVQLWMIVLFIQRFSAYSYIKLQILQILKHNF